MFSSNSKIKQINQWALVPFLCAAVLHMAEPVAAQEVSNRGKEFIMTFLPNFDDDVTIELHLTGADTDVTVEYPADAPTFTTTVPVSSGNITIVELPTQAGTDWTANSVNSNAIRASADEDFVVYMNNLRPFATDSSVALPVAAMNTEYFVVGYTPSQENGSHFSVVSAFDATTVYITPTNPMGDVLAGETLEVQLDRGEAFFGRSNGSGPANDLTGTLITASQPVGMTSGNRCSTIQEGVPACDTVFQAGHPTQTWGTEIPVANLPLRDGGSIYRILAAEDGTVVNRNGVPIATLNRGEFHETTFLTGNHLFTADQPIFVIQFMTGIANFGTNGVGDPAMGNMIPNEQYLNRYTFSTVGGDQFARHFVTILAETEDLGNSLEMNGELLDANLFSPIPGTSLMTTSIEIPEGVYTTDSASIHGITVQGYNDSDSYLYPGGARFEFIGGTDETPPVCDFDILGELAEGTVQDDGEEDSGVFIVRLLDGFENVELQIESFTPGDPVVHYTLSHLDTSAIAFGTVEGVDGSGNRCTSFIEFEPQPEDIITVVKFFDANADGVWDSETEPVLEGWRMILSPDSASSDPAEQFTDAEGIVSWRDIDTGHAPFFVEEGVSVIGSWFQTSPTDSSGDPVNPAEVGESMHLEFGNYCLTGSNGKSLGFWGNPNGRRIVDASEGDYLELLSGLNLRDAQGAHFSPDSSNILSSWLRDANARNMANMLSAQLAAMALNVTHGFVEADAYDVVYGAKVSQILDDANVLLSDETCGDPCVTESGSALRPDQKVIKDTLDRLNNDGELIPVTSCDFTFEILE